MKIGIFIIINALILGQRAYLSAAQISVPAEISTESLRLVPQGAPAQEEGRIYYDNSQNKFYFFDGSAWQVLGVAADSKAASIVVAAYNSRGSTRDGINPCLGDGSACSNPKADYTCDGLNDGSTINSAITSLGTTGGTIYLLEGNYDNEGISFGAGSHKSLIGMGRSTILKRQSDSITDIQILAGEHIIISNLTLEGNSDSLHNTIFLVNPATKYCLLDNIWLKRSGNIYMLNDTQWNRVSNIQMDRGMITLHGSSNNMITHNSVESNEGIWVRKSEYSSGYNIIAHNRVKNSAMGIHIGGVSGIYGGKCQFNSISYNHIEATASASESAQIDVEGSSYSRVGYNTVINSSAGSGIRIRSYDLGSTVRIPPNSLICGNRISNNYLWGILLEGRYDTNGVNDDNNIVSDNLLFDNAAVFGSGPSDVTSGEICASASNGNILSGNLLFQEPLAGDAHAGFKFDTSRYNYLSGNYIYNSTGSILIPATNTDIYGTGTERITLVPGNFTGMVEGGTLTPVGPVSFMRLNPAAGITLASIAPGKTAGHILVLEGLNDAAAVNIPNNHGPAVLLDYSSAAIPLYNRDILVLIWDGQQWAELSRQNNSGG